MEHESLQFILTFLTVLSGAFALSCWVNGRENTFMVSIFIAVMILIVTAFFTALHLVNEFWSWVLS